MCFHWQRCDTFSGKISCYVVPSTGLRHIFDHNPFWCVSIDWGDTHFWAKSLVMWFHRLGWHTFLSIISCYVVPSTGLRHIFEHNLFLCVSIDWGDTYFWAISLVMWFHWLDWDTFLGNISCYVFPSTGLRHIFR